MVNRFAEQRVKKGISVEKLSELTGITVSELVLYEAPEFSVEEMSAVKAALIAEALGCFISDLIYN